ncbi:hypothetical protein [Kitasatospora phosalacinea]|uniref:Uncharacterized protein n=1 Tax=Kitasatospora phosalacinea TaxID=2065 RepID=A0A9W6PKX8_9ACTN|nr:hypothetical protein [Kitasatospora phosalacinea]GLW58190.1 hypothetical protein Kpho01_62010 [Kitasatospora phosalacinea]
MLRDHGKKLAQLAQLPAIPPSSTVSDHLYGFVQLHDHLLGEAEAPQPGTDRDSVDAVAHQRASVAYAWAAVLTARAHLFAAPALVAAVQVEGRGRGATAEELALFRAALSEAHTVIEEAASATWRVARNLSGPERDVLRTLNSRPAGAKAASAARARAKPPRILSAGAAPQAAAPAGQSAAPGRSR